MPLGLAAQDARDPSRQVDDALAALCATPDPDIPASERRLCALPAGDVLPAIASHPMRAMPADGIWNATGHDDERMPLAWRIHYALGRVEAHHHREASPAELRRARARITGLTPDDPMVTLWLAVIHRAPPEERLAAAKAVFVDEARPIGDRVTAAAALLDLDAQQSYARVSAFAVEHDVVEPLLDRLARPHAPPLEVDPRVVRWAFRKLEAEVAANPESVNVPYFTARRIEGLVRQSFAPDSRSPRWRGEHGLKDEFFAQTVANALAWWEAHRAEYER